ncbi:MAG: hypothetical protein R3E89_14505 [Thiolinea sp.]
MKWPGLAAPLSIAAQNACSSMTSAADRQQFLQGLIDTVPDGVRVIDSYYIGTGNAAMPSRPVTPARNSCAGDIAIRSLTGVIRLSAGPPAATPGTARLP